MYKIGHRFKTAEIAAGLTVVGSAYVELHKSSVPVVHRAQILKLRREYLNGTARPPIDIVTHMVNTSDLYEYLDEGTAAVYDQLMSAQLILCWTAFETLANDLWEAAVNEHPQTLARMESKNVPGSAKTGKQEGKSVPLSYLEKYGYNIADKMGTILIDKRGGLRRLEEIQEAYQLSFPTGCRIADPAFWADQDVRSASAIRNLLIHTSGNVDQDFLNKRGADPRLVHYQLGDPFFLDGKLLSEVLTGLFSFAKELVSLVDDWIVANPR